MSEEKEIYVTENPAKEIQISESPYAWNTHYVDPEGFKCQLTIREESGVDLFKKVESALDWLAKKGCRPFKGYDHLSNGGPAPASGPPTPSPTGSATAPPGKQNGGPEETFEVVSISHSQTESGHHFVRVKGGKYKKYGVKAWPEVLPADAEHFEEWPLGQEYEPGSSMRFAACQGSKVIRFFTE